MILLSHLLLMIIIIATLIISSNTFIMYAIHDVSRLWQSSSDSKPSSPMKQILNSNLAIDDDTGKILLRLIEQGQKLTKETHKKLSDKESQKPNKYRKILVEELDYLEMLLKKAESHLHCLRNPFMKKLIHYTQKDLELMINYYKIILQLYDQGDDQSMPVLTNLVQQLIEQADLDVGHLNSNGYRDYANKISDHSGRIQTMLHDLKQTMDELNTQSFSDKIKKILSSLVDFENLVLNAEKHSNINNLVY